MSYQKAEEFLPLEIIELIQEYVDGKSIYIPRKKNHRQEWGSSTESKKELKVRNLSIFKDYQKGSTISELSQRYFLSEKSIQRILYQMKKVV